MASSSSSSRKQRRRRASRRWTRNVEVGTKWSVLGDRLALSGAIFRNTTTDLRVPSYWLTNATVAYEVNSHLTLRLNATNLTDEHYTDRVGGGHHILGPGRSVQFTTSVGS